MFENKNYELWNGDCLDLMRNIPDKSIDMVLCDLPYGTTACEWDEIIPLGKLWEQYKRLIKKGGMIVLFASQPFTTKLIHSNIDNFKYEWIWEKQTASNFLTAKHQPLKNHENICVFSYNGNRYYPQKYRVIEIDDICRYNKKQLRDMFEKRTYWKYGKIDKRKNVVDDKSDKTVVGIEINRTRKKDDGTRYPKSVLKINTTRNNVHPTQKPIELLEYLVKTYTQEGEIVLDNTMGSGSTGVACMNTGRKFIGIELEQKYFDIAVKRICH